MDSRKITKGTTVYLPVRVPGGLLAMGDVHAVMGDGEVCETGVEINADIQVRIRLIKNFELNWPVTVLTSAGDWNVDFFKKNGYLVRGELKDVPKGHNCYELYKKM